MSEGQNKHREHPYYWDVILLNKSVDSKFHVINSNIETAGCQRIPNKEQWQQWWFSLAKLWHTKCQKLIEIGALMRVQCCFSHVDWHFSVNNKKKNRNKANITAFFGWLQLHQNSSRQNLREWKTVFSYCLNEAGKFNWREKKSHSLMMWDFLC